MNIISLCFDVRSTKVPSYRHSLSEEHFAHEFAISSSQWRQNSESCCPHQTHQGSTSERRGLRSHSLPALLHSSYQTGYRHTSYRDPPGGRCCSASVHSHQIAEKVGGGAFAAGGDERRESEKRLGRSILRDGEHGCSCRPEIVWVQYESTRKTTTARSNPTLMSQSL